jgi:riboflavin kinase/FMN adenylyltransferase
MRIPSIGGSSVVTIGNFDGVHLGHQSLVASLLEEGRRRGVPSVALLFDPHPTVVLGTKIPPRITSIDDRIRLLEGLGVDHVFVEKFTRELQMTSAEAYLEQLVRRLGMEFLCVGPTTHIGSGRGGTPGRLREIGRELGFSVNVADEYRIGGETVSSSRIRRRIEEGDVEGAGRLLGRWYRTTGEVVRGDGRGKTLGFPTANLGGIPTLVPARGVYAVLGEVDGVSIPAAANVGYRPTVREIPELAVEIHLLGYRGSLVGRLLQVTWIARLRDERKFESEEALRQQIEQDCRAVREILKEELKSS